MAAALTQGPPHGDDQSVGTSAAIAYTVQPEDVDSRHTVVIRIQNTHASQTLTVGGSDVAAGSNGAIIATQYGFVDIPARHTGQAIYVAGSGAATTFTVTKF